MKGFTRDGKFHPITDYKKGVRKSRNQSEKEQGIRLERVQDEKPLTQDFIIRNMDKKFVSVNSGLVISAEQMLRHMSRFSTMKGTKERKEFKNWKLYEPERMKRINPKTKGGREIKRWVGFNASSSEGAEWWTSDKLYDLKWIMKENDDTISEGTPISRSKGDGHYFFGDLEIYDTKKHPKLLEEMMTGNWDE